MSYETLLTAVGDGVGRYLQDLIALVGLSEDAAEGIAAFVEKREPEWRGR